MAHTAIVVGSSFGGRVHVPALRAAGVGVHAIVGRDQRRTEERARALGVPIAATSLAKVLAEGVATCVTVATPPDSHTEPVLEALDSGCHVLCEKPFALNAGRARQMRDAAAATDRVAMVGCEFRWMPEEELARRAVAGGLIGEARVATLVQHSGIVADGIHGAFNEEWWFDASRGGGMLNAGGVHYIDRLRTWLGEVTGLSASVRVAGDRPTTQADDTYTSMLRFDRGCIAMIQHCSATHAAPVRLCRVVGTLGTVSLEGGEAVLASSSGCAPLPIPADLRLPPPPPPSSDPKHAFTQLELPGYIRLAERFRLLMDGETPSAEGPPTPTFDDGLRNQIVVDAMRSSSEAGGAWVEISY